MAANPLDVVYEAVAELSCHNVSSGPEGWVDVNLVAAASCKALSCDMDLATFIALEALDSWCVLAVMDFNPMRSKIKFVVPFSISDGREHPVLPIIPRARRLRSTQNDKSWITRSG